MRLYFGLTVILLSCVCSSMEICKEDAMGKCLITLLQFMEEYYRFNEITEDKLNEFCLKFKTDGDCLKDVSDVCKEEHRFKTGISEGIYKNLNHQCSPGKGKPSTLMDMLQCVRDHQSDFEKCVPNHEPTNEDSQRTTCLAINSWLCIARNGRKFCKDDGKAFAESLEYGIRESHDQFCNGIVSYKYDYWNFLILTIILLMIETKLKQTLTV